MSDLARAQAEADRLLEDVKLNRTHGIYFLNCPSLEPTGICMEPVDLAEFVETGYTRCPKCNQLLHADLDNMRFMLQGN